MKLDYQRRLAADILGVGKERVKFDEAHLKEIQEAVSREAIKSLIEKGYIYKVQEKGTSRARANYIAQQKKKGRRRGEGKRKGKATAIISKKDLWMRQIRAVRKALRELKEKGEIDVSQYRYLYRQASAGRIKTKAYLRMLVEKLKKEESAKA